MNITREWLATQTYEIVGNGREFKLNCPNCDDETKHLYANADRGLWYCFKCGKGGKIIGNDMDAHNIDELYKTGILKSGDIVRVKSNLDFGPSKLIKSLPVSYPIRNIADGTPGGYLKSRGINEDEIVKYNIRASQEKNGPYRNCIVFPISTSLGAVEYFICRKYDDSKPKYINAPWAKEGTLFIADNQPMGSSTGIIVEGIFDALAIARIGFTGIALLGKKATSQQLTRLISLYRYYAIYLDRDALTQAIELKMQLDILGNKTKLITHEKDAADLYMDGDKQLNRLISHAILTP